jgi:hypothetical protein
MIDIERKLKHLRGIESMLTLINVSIAQLAISHCESQEAVDAFVKEYGSLAEALMEPKQ